MNFAIVYPEIYKLYFDKISRSMQMVFQDMGHHCILTHDIEVKSDVVVVQCGLYYRTFSRQPNQKYILVQMEQFPNAYANSGWQMQKWIDTKSFLHCYDCVWDTYYDLHKYLYDQIKGCQFHLGYHELFDAHQTVAKKYDVSFFGSLNERRKSIMYQLPKLKISGNVQGDRRDTFINESKINLNIHYSDSPMLETLRVIMFLLCNKAFVMTEKFVGCDLLKDREHLVVINQGDIVEKTAYFLSEKELRQKISEQGYQFIKNEFRLESHIKNCLKYL